MSPNLVSLTKKERRFEKVLVLLREMYVRAAGCAPPMLDELIEPKLRRDSRTLNYPVATAPGTLQDRIFTPSNGDKITRLEEEAFNRGYRTLLDEAVELAWHLGLPATRDRFRRRG